MRKQAFRRLGALLAAACLLLGTALPGALAAQEEHTQITIATAEDWEDLAKRCALDAWSRGRTVVLTADLDLSGRENVCVPTFGGTLLGQGHTISGLRIKDAGSNRGLFRYLQSGAVVRDLTVKGLVAPEGSRSTVGGLAGENRGTIQNCTFQGAVTGENTVGGLVGRNSDSGQVLDCTVTGTVAGRTATGGIAGRNAGLLLRCTNRAGVNLTEGDERQISLELDPESALTDRAAAQEEDTAAGLDGATDTGGIAGYSSGIIQSCRNHGDVGYPHVGYNTGGIVGRQSGYLAGCANDGTIHGRKDVGGIAGQAEPWLVLEPGTQTLDRLRNELDTLDRLVTRVLNDAESTGDQVSLHLTKLGAYTGDARDSSRRLLDRTGDFVDENIREANDLAADVTAALDLMSPALEDLADAGDRLMRLSRQLEDFFDSAGAASDAFVPLRSAAEGLRQGQAELSAAVQELRGALETLHNAVFPDGIPTLPSPADLAAARARVQAAFDHLQSAGDQVNGALADLRQALVEAGALADAAEALRGVPDTTAAIGRLLESAFDTLHDGMDRLTENGTPQFSPLGESAREASDSLFDALGGLSGELETLHNTVDGGSDTLLADLRAINRQFNIVCNVLADAVDSVGQRREDGIDSVVQDTSDEDIAATREGKLTDCVNEGDVEGDRNVGGIAGALAIEWDLDPEDDGADRFTFGSTYETKAVVVNCTGRGSITAKKDCAGGIAGRMDLGTVLDCQSYAAVTSTGGDYTGGIAGFSDGVVRGCFAKNRLSGGNYIGGIAGWPGRLRDCYAITTVEEGTECLGAVAGDMEAGGILTGNRFVDTGLAGVDGVSYAGGAEPIAFEELAALPGVPGEFLRFTVTCVSEGEVLARLPFQYGEDLSELALPALPEREGCYGAWPAFDTTGLCSDITLEAVYESWVTLVASEETEEKLPLAMAEGRFTREAALHVQPASVSLADAVSSVHPEEDVWEITLTGTALGPEDEVPLRLLNRMEGRAEVLAYRDGRWVPVAARQSGSYLLLTMTGTQGVFRIQPQASVLWLLPVLAGGGALLAAALLVRRLRRKRKHAVKASEKPPVAAKK